MEFNINSKQYWSYASLFICIALFLVWPLAHTIALRKLLLLAGAVIGLVLWWRSEDRNHIIKSPWLLWMGVLGLWIVVHIAFIAQNQSEAWREFSGQWAPVYMAIFAGMGLGLAGRFIAGYKYKALLLSALIAQPLTFLFVTVYKSIEFGTFAFGYNVVNLGTDLKPSLTFSAELLGALACSKLASSVGSGRKDKTRHLWWLAWALAMFVVIAYEVLNAVLLIGGAMLLLQIYLAFKMMAGRRYLQGAGLALAILTALGILAMQAVPHWAKLRAHVVVAWDIDQYRNWINFRQYGLPHNQYGDELPESIYLRIAYARAAAAAIIETPLGYGVTRKSFERLIQQEHPEAALASPHNGYLGMACAIGIPGLILFGMVLISVFRLAVKSESEYAQHAIWMIGIYALHWMLDPLERDHFFESYLFVIALLMTLVNKEKLAKY